MAEIRQPYPHYLIKGAYEPETSPGGAAFGNVMPWDQADTVPFLPGDPDGKKLIAETQFEERVALLQFDEKARAEARRRNTREALASLGETGWQFADLRSAFEELKEERQKPTVGTWTRKANLDGMGMREEDGHGILYSRKVNLIFGPSESGKSMFAFAIVAQEVREGNFVVVLDFEDDQYGLVSRMTDLGLDIEEIDPEGAKPGGVYYIPARLGMEDDDYTLIRERVEGGVSLILVDAVTEAMSADGLDPDKAVQVAQWAASMPKRFAKLGPAVGIVDHTNLSDTDRAGGSQHKKSMVDGVSLKVKRTQTFTPGRGGRASIYVAKDRVGSVREQSVPADPDKPGDQEYRGTFAMNLPADAEPFAMIGRNPLDLHQPTGDTPTAKPSKEERMIALMDEVEWIVTGNPGIAKGGVKERIEAEASAALKQAAVDEAERLGRIRVVVGARNARQCYPSRERDGTQEELL